MSTIPQIVKDARTAMDRAVDSTRKEFSSVRTGKASPAMLDSVPSTSTRISGHRSSMPSPLVKAPRLICMKYPAG